MQWLLMRAKRVLMHSDKTIKRKPPAYLKLAEHFPFPCLETPRTHTKSKCIMRQLWVQTCTINLCSGWHFTTAFCQERKQSLHWHQCSHSVQKTLPGISLFNAEYLRRVWLGKYRLVLIWQGLERKWIKTGSLTPL